MTLDAEDFVPEGRDNHFVNLKTGHILVCRAGQTVAELVAEMEAEAANPVPERRLVRKSLILSRPSDVQLEAALAAMTVPQKERWRSPDKPAVYADDTETRALLVAIGADPDVVLAAE